MRLHPRLIAPALFVGGGLLALVACDRLLTESPDSGEVFDGPIDGLSDELNRMFVRGDENFGKVFSAANGLGPIFNQPGCESCHPGDGRGTPAQALIRFSVGSDLVHRLGGPQLQDKAIAGATPETLPDGVDTSSRLPPPVFGMGFIEAIPATTIISLADSLDTDGDGISGRVNWVRPADFVPENEIGGGSSLQVGRFGRKASVAALIEQVVAAYHQDVGITSDFLPFENVNIQAGGTGVGDAVPDPEIASHIVNETTMYVRLLAPPARGPSNQKVENGASLFNQIGCASCHVPSLTTGPHPIPQLSNVDVALYSDLLLHDMGPALADNRPDGSATGTEWRTAPLWGTRLVPKFLNGEAFYLHDGRATSIDQAIRYHDGEAALARSRFENLAEDEREALISFVESL
jgi:CxxC motif-containing protein (DUF1111 family)